MKLKVVLAGLMALVGSAVPVEDNVGRYNHTSLRTVPSMHIVPATDSYAYNANKVSTRDFEINPPLDVCIDIFEKANLDYTGPKMLGTCGSNILCKSIVDSNRPRSQQILKTIGSIRMEGNTTCGVYESDDCFEGTLRETISEKNMLSWPPVIPIGSWRASLHCYRLY